MSKVTEKAKKRVVKKKVDEKPDLQEELKPKVDPVVEHHREIMRMATELMEKCTTSDKDSDIAIFLALRVPGMMWYDETGNKMDAIAFSAGKMMNVAELVNQILSKHKELAMAMQMDAKINKVMEMFGMGAGSRVMEEVTSAQSHEGFKEAIKTLRAVIDGRS